MSFVARRSVSSVAASKISRATPSEVPNVSGEMRQQELADSLGWDKSRISHQLSRMAERGLLERRREQANTVNVGITRKGRAKLDVARVVHARAVRKCLLEAIPAEERRSVLALLVRLSPP